MRTQLVSALSFCAVVFIGMVALNTLVVGEPPASIISQSVDTYEYNDTVFVKLSQTMNRNNGNLQHHFYAITSKDGRVKYTLPSLSYTVEKPESVIISTFFVPRELVGNELCITDTVVWSKTLQIGTHSYVNKPFCFKIKDRP